MALSQLPVSVMEATLFSSIVYPMVGFHLSTGHFLTFWLTVASSNLCLSALFRWVGQPVQALESPAGSASWIAVSQQKALPPATCMLASHSLCEWVHLY